MKICILGFDGASAQEIFQDERLGNLRRLMDIGLYGRLQPVGLSSNVPAWLCMAASQDPTSLATDSPAGKVTTIWDCVAGAGKQSILVAVPRCNPPLSADALSLGGGRIADPQDIVVQVIEKVGDYPFGAQTAPTESPEDLIAIMSRQWEVVRWLLVGKEWGYFHFVDIGLGTIQSKFPEATDDYRLWLDEQLGLALEAFDDQTIVLAVSPGGTGNDANESGFFVLAAPNCPLCGEFEGGHLLDIAPTLLDLAGYAIPATMQGKSWVAGLEKKTPGGGSSAEDEKLILDRLAGLGYV